MQKVQDGVTQPLRYILYGVAIVLGVALAFLSAPGGKSRSSLISTVYADAPVVPPPPPPPPPVCRYVTTGGGDYQSTVYVCDNGSGGGGGSSGSGGSQGSSPSAGGSTAGTAGTSATAGSF